jgi:hypothetical protein
MRNVKDTAPASPVADTAADLRASVASLADIVRSQSESLALLAQAALAPRPRNARRSVAVATVSEADRACAEGGFRRGYRASMFRDLLGKGEGVYPLSDIVPVTNGYPARSAIPVAQAIARRLSRRPLVGYTLIVDIDEADAGKTDLVFAARKASDPVDTSPETEGDKAE